MKELRTLLIVILVIGLFSGLFTTFTGKMFQGYGNFTNVTYIGASQQTMEKIDAMQGNLTKTDTTTIGIAGFLILAPYRIGLMVFGAVGIAQGLTNDVANVLHVPVVVVDTFIAIMFIIVMFGILKIIQRTSAGGY